MFGKDKDKKESENQNQPKLGKGVSQQDYDRLTEYFRNIYNIYEDQIEYSKKQLEKADAMLKDDFKWNDTGAQTLKKGALKRIEETEKHIRDLLSKCKQYESEGKLKRFW